MAIIANLPYNFTNGTTADASQVMQNFNQIVNNVNTNAAQLTLTPQLASENVFTQPQQMSDPTKPAHAVTLGYATNNIGFLGSANTWTKNNVFSGGIDNTPIGQNTPAAGKFTNGVFTGSVSASQISLSQQTLPNLSTAFVSLGYSGKTGLHVITIKSPGGHTFTFLASVGFISGQYYAAAFGMLSQGSMTTQQGTTTQNAQATISGFGESFSYTVGVNNANGYLVISASAATTGNTAVSIMPHTMN